VVNCTISGNGGGIEGGGLTCVSSVAVRNTIFEGNTAFAITEFGFGADPIVENCLFYNNPDGAYYDDGGTPPSTLTARSTP